MSIQRVVLLNFQFHSLGNPVGMIYRQGQVFVFDEFRRNGTSFYMPPLWGSLTFSMDSSNMTALRA